MTDKGKILIPMIRETPEPKPGFAHVKDESGHVIDIIAFAVDEAILEYVDVEVFELEDWQAEVGDRVAVCGYPTAVDNWPDPEKQIDASIIGYNPGGAIHFAPLASHGFSGGPMISKHGELLGMVVGSNGHGTALMSQAIRMVIDSALSRRKPLPNGA
ncbi:trypsin-like peptidase domain-containing protein [Methylobacterium gnaphalii]|nr:trypsin-like peptidase domain-containing protein [Methylobacterium gnaphalii]